MAKELTRPEIIAGLESARRGLIEAGYFGPSDHGQGDDEVLAIEAVLRAYNDGESIHLPGCSVTGQG